ncbi:uncharacterized protein TNCV_81871 [Trichonephila clavipes]|nr:uncharacterized protein TNCV_81871 [Trichonephila clavipes]
MIHRDAHHLGIHAIAGNRGNGEFDEHWLAPVQKHVGMSKIDGLTRHVALSEKEGRLALYMLEERDVSRHPMGQSFLMRASGNAGRRRNGCAEFCVSFLGNGLRRWKYHLTLGIAGGRVAVWVAGRVAGWVAGRGIGRSSGREGSYHVRGWFASREGSSHVPGWFASREGSSHVSGWSASRGSDSSLVRLKGRTGRSPIRLKGRTGEKVGLAGPPIQVVPPILAYSGIRSVVCTTLNREPAQAYWMVPWSKRNNED